MMRVVDFPLLLLTLGSVLIAVKGNDWMDECTNPLGMESGKIPASRITASSSFDEKSVGPQNSRIRQENAGGAWCPRIQIEDGVKEYLEIDFGGEFRLTQTETQGRFGNGRGLEFAEQFKIEYYRDSLGKWIPYKDHFGRTIFDANRNTYLGVIQQLNPPIIATRLRFIPYSLHPRTICMRVEAYGCHFTDGVVYYECPNGYWKKNPLIDFRDSSYDGWMNESGTLQGGLGLLVNKILGNEDAFTKRGSGNMWIGWDNHNNQSVPIKIGFQFDRLRKFYEVSIHVNNFVSQGAQVFASVDIYFSMDGQKFSDFPLRWTPKGELKNETAHLVQIPLRGRLATYIRLEFFHSNHWLLLSEIFFRSDIFTGNVTDEILSLNYLQDGPHDKSSDKDEIKDVVAGTSSTTTSSGAMIGLIAGSLSVLVVLLIVTLVCYVMRRNRRNTKLVGVMGMTPKSMSMGLGGCGESNSHSQHKTSSTSTVINSGTSRRMGKIALCDLKPVSISGEGDSDESLYHELVFGLGGGGGGLGGLSKSDGSPATLGGSFSHHPSSSSSSARKNNNSNRKIKYQRVNHGSDFSDFMGLRSIHDELSFFNPSSPSTPASSSNKQNLSHHLSHSHQTILPPPPTFRHHHHHLLDHQPQSQSQQQQSQQLHHPLLNLQSSSKTLSSLGNGNCNGNLQTGGGGGGGGSVFTTCSSKSSSAIPSATAAAAATTLGFFNSPHGRRPPPSSSSNNPTLSQSSNIKNNLSSSQSNYYAATDIFQVTDKHFDRF